jgi:hypothetical protein
MIIAEGIKKESPPAPRIDGPHRTPLPIIMTRNAASPQPELLTETENRKDSHRVNTIP